MAEAVDKAVLGVAGEFAVAAELCRRNMYAQPTFGNQKRADLLVLSHSSLLRVEVKAKQGPDWPNCNGVSGDNVVLVFVDFHKKAASERPDFYVLSSADWRAVVDQAARRYMEKHPNRRAVVDESSRLVLLDEVNKQGRPYIGCGVRPADVAEHKDAWSKVSALLGAQSPA